MKNYKLLFRVTFGALVMACFALAFIVMPSYTPEYNPMPTVHWTKNGASAPVLVTKQIKVLHVKATPTVANGGSIDLTDCGLTTIINCQISAKRNNANAYDVPQVSIKTLSTSSLTYNIVQGSNTLVSVLGFSVLQGPSTIFATDLSNIELNVLLIGY